MMPVLISASSPRRLFLLGPPSDCLDSSQWLRKCDQVWNWAHRGALSMSLTIAFHIRTQIQNAFMRFFVPWRSVGIKRMNQERASRIKPFFMKDILCPCLE